MTEVEKSPSFSFKFWDVWEFIKGRKKMAITVVAAVLGYLITDSEVAAVVAGSAVEMLWAILEYYATEQEYEIVEE